MFELLILHKRNVSGQNQAWTDSVHISLTQLLDGQNYMALLGLKDRVILNV